MNKTEIKEEQAIYMDLYEKLKSMKFSGMAEELRLQLENPNSDLESFQDRFEKLVTAEWNLRYNKKFQRYLKKAKLKIPGQHLMRSFIIRIDNLIYQQSKS